MTRRRPQQSIASDVDLVTVICYRRVSRIEQKIEGLSLVAQTQEAARYILEDQNRIIGPSFEDVLFGRRDDRVQYQEMLRTVRELRARGRRVVVLVVALDRLGRNLMERVRAYRELAALGVEIHSVREGGHVPEFGYNMYAVMAQEESRRTGERVRASRQVARQAGWMAVGRVPWGYRLRPATPEERMTSAPQKVYDLEPDQALYAREAWRMLADGAHIRSIHRWVQHLPDLAVGGRAFSYSTLRDFFFSPTSVGRLGRFDGEVPVLQLPTGNWPTLIDDDTWQQAHLTLARHRRLPPRSVTLHLLSGYIRCPACGFRLSGRARSLVRRGKSQARYSCQAHNGNRQSNGSCTFSCHAPSIETNVLDRVLSLLEALDDPLWRRDVERAWERLRNPKAEIDQAQRVKQLQAAVGRNRALVMNATRQYAGGEIMRGPYDDLVDALGEESRRANDEIDRLTVERPHAALPPLHTVLGDVADWQQALNSKDVTEARAVLAGLVETIVPVKRRYGHYDAEITWSPLGRVMNLVSGATEET
jgi:DNA invertase Pin-like site-specific DNA recombinase